MYQRTIQKRIESDLFLGKMLIIYGARQVGKTTLIKEILRKYNGLYFDCQVRSVQDFMIPDPEHIKSRIGDARLVAFDEAQYISDIGRVLKVFHDRYPEVQVIATGSSAFDLANKTAESMAGRVREYLLYPLSVAEIINSIGRAVFDERFENFLRFGFYPGIVDVADEKKRTDLEFLESSVLYKDILALDGVRKPRVLTDLLRLLALSVGSEISAHSLANNLNTSLVTINKYLDILEKMFVIVRMRAFSRNLGVEIRKGYKVYFIDLGIRNSILQNHNALAVRQDAGALFENFFIIERMKLLGNAGSPTNFYFWRTIDQKELDLIEERAGTLFAFECKLMNGKVAGAKRFLALHPGSAVTVATRENGIDLLL